MMAIKTNKSMLQLFVVILAVLLLRNSGLTNLSRGSYKVKMKLEKKLKASFPNPGDEENIREIFRQDIELDKLGMGAHMVGSEIHFFYPISIYAGNK